jgi:3-deoxy-D-manno-octulosonate 8-phosphate phosphatase KdsC-like HAD superfamily phosphatase
MLRCAGLPVAVADATMETRDAAIYVTKAREGLARKGDVRDHPQGKGEMAGILRKQCKTKLGFT